MEGVCCKKSPPGGCAFNLFCLAGLIISSTLLPTASAFSAPFSIPFLSSPDQDAELSLVLDQPLVEYGSRSSYTLQLENSGRAALTDISVWDNFGQVGFLARLPSGESFGITRTTPPLRSTTSLKVMASSGGEVICRDEAAVQVGLPETLSLVPDLDRAKPAAEQDQILRTTSVSPEIELVVGADPKAVRPGEKTTVRMTVTNRCSQTIRDVEISGPGWTVEAGDLQPGESKTYSRGLIIAEDLSAELTATGTTDGKERAADRERLQVAVVSSDLSVTVTSRPAGSGQAATTEYRLNNEGDELLSRVTLKDGRGATLGILSQLGPGDSESLTRTRSGDEEVVGTIEVTAVSPEGRTITGEVVVQPSSARASASKPTSRSGSTTPSRALPSIEEGEVAEFEEMDLELNLDGFGSDVSGMASEDRKPRAGRSAAGPELEDGGPVVGFWGLDLGFDFGSFGFVNGFGPSPAGGVAELITRSRRSDAETRTEETETGSPALVVTIQANRTLVHEGDLVGYRCAAVNRGRVSLSDLTLRCGEETAKLQSLPPGDGFPLQGVMRVERSLNLTAFASATGPGGSKLDDEAALSIGVVSPDLLVEVGKEPERICRGQRTTIVVRLENSGNDPLSEVEVTDALGEIGTVPVIEPGEVRTLVRNSTLHESIEDVVLVVATDSTGGRLQRSEVLKIELLEPRLDLTVDTEKAAAYPGDPVEAVWTIRNSGDVDLVDVTFQGEGASSFRLPAVAAGGSTSVSSVYFADESRAVSGRAEGRTAGGETVSASAAFEIRSISPGISLNVRPAVVESCPGRSFNLTALVTNSGDDPLKGVTLSERSLGTLEKIGRLEPGDFKVTDLGFFAEKNTTLMIEVEGIDSMGNAWSDSQKVAVKLVTAKIELSIRADPPETTPGGSVNVVLTVENGGDVPIFSTFVTGGLLGQLGTIDYISPGSSRTLEKKIEITEEIEDEIIAEGFTKDRDSVRDEAILSMGLKVPAEEPVPAESPYPGAAWTEAVDVGAEEAKVLEGAVPAYMVNESDPTTSEVREGEGSGISGLVDRLKKILEKIRLSKESSVDGASSEAPASGTMPAGSGPGSSSVGPASASPPGASGRWSGYGTSEEGTCASPSAGETKPQPAGYAYSAAGPRSSEIYSPGPELEMTGYSYSAEGLASSYLSSPWTSPGPSGQAYSASGPASAYLYSSWASGYASSGGGSLSAPTSAAGISTNLASPLPPPSREADLRTASTASPKVAEARGSVEGPSPLRISEISPGHSEVAVPAGSPSMDGPFQSKSPTENIRLIIGDPSTIEVDRPPKIIDVGAFPPEPAAWSPVVVAVHASDDTGIRSVEMLWDTPTTSVSRMDLVDITKINTQRMGLEEGDSRDGYWSYEIPGQAAGTYMAVMVKVSDGERWAEDGPYILFWSETAPDEEGAKSAASEEGAEKDGRSGGSAGAKKGGMLFVESTTVVGRGDISIKNEVRESSARYKEELDGYGSIEMQSQKTVNRGNPVVNISDSRLLVFDQGYLKGFKVMQSPAFHGGMGASVTEQFSATTLEKSETGTISSVNRSDHTLLFNTQQAFEGIWGTKTEYSNFNKKIKAKQQLNGTFETQKKISFED